MTVASVLLALVLSGLRPRAPQPPAANTIESIVISGNRRVPTETIKHYMLTKVGDTLNADVVGRDVKTLYAQGYFDDIRVNSEDTTSGGLIVTFIVKEKPLIRSIDLTGSSAITKSDILAKLKEKKISVSQESPYDPAGVKKVESVLKSMLAEKGHQEATIETVTEDVAPNGIRLTFKISEGPAIKVEKIIIQGNEVFSGKQIKRAMKLVKEISPLSVLTSKNTYYDLKLADDVTRIRMFYADHGFVRANISDPVVETRSKSVYRTLPLIKPPLPFGIPLPFWKKKVNRFYITLKIEENRQFTVNRINITGNTKTRDKVIRREVLVEEGQVFNSQLWDVSLLRLNQLGYFEEIKNEDAEIQPHPTDPTLDVNLKVKEKGRNSIGFSGGVSGIGGSFVGLNYATNNFLGLGESIGMTLQGGTRQSQYELSFTEPYLYDRPVSLGFSVYSTSFRYDQARELFGLNPGSLPQGLGLENRLNFEQKHTGFNLSTGYPVKVFQRIGLSYVLDNSETTGINPATQAYFSTVTTQNQNFITGGSFTTFHARRLTPSYTYSTVNNPYNPTRGHSFTGSFEFTGGFLRGDINFYRPTGDFRYYRPMYHGRNTLAMRLTGSYVQSFTNLSVPFYERFFAGGDFDIRGFDFRTLSPISFITRTLATVDPISLKTVNKPYDDIVYVGGDTQAVFNLEYRIPIIGQTVSLVPFMDAGNTWVLKKDALERRIVTPGLIQTLPAQFLPGTNSGLRMSTGIEFQVVMPVVNAPFRLDFVFNPARIDQNYNGPVTGIPFGIHQPAHEFKFTVGRTF